MQNTYNIYRMNTKKNSLFEKKLREVELIKQKKKTIGEYEFTFYFSEHLKGNDIWWYKTYEDFFKSGVQEPKNTFYYALLVIQNMNNNSYKYLISLGKSHFYLQKVIDYDFGINVAIHIAKEETLLMKKSRFFSGAKKQEIASYIKFEPNNYRPGESVDHLKLKAADESIWGDKNIVFSDSIQMDLELPPDNLVKVIEEIENSLKGESLIALPKMEKVNDDDDIKILDTILIEQLLKKQSTINVSDFSIYGIEICFTFLNYNYEIYYWDDAAFEKKNVKKVGSSIDMEVISNYLLELPAGFNIDNVKVRFFLGDKGRFTQGIKEIIDIHINLHSISYALKNGSWYLFNQVFIDFLDKSLKEIPFVRQEDFIEKDYLAWKIKKESDIKSGIAKDELVYPEYYFNELQTTKSYELMDRECEVIKSLKRGARKYSVEVADLYRDKTVFAVKLDSHDNKVQLIYNIEQSKDSILLLKNGAISTDKLFNKACLWFVLTKKIERVTDINSIQFLLAIETWKQAMLDNNISPMIYYSFYKK